LLDKHRAMLVAKGFSLQAVDYEETFALSMNVMTPDHNVGGGGGGYIQS
jgi:hypothetical protein